MTFNWTALLVAAAGAAVGGIVGDIAARARGGEQENSVLIGAALGAIVASVATPKALPAS